MEVSNSTSTLKLVVQTEVIKKSQNVQKNILTSLLNNMNENIKKEVAEFTNKGNNIDIKA